jgi:heme A synthase
VVADQDRPPGSPLKGVILGVLVDIVGTIVAGLLIGILYGILLAGSGTDMAEAERLASDPTSGVGLAGLATGFAFSFLGGYVCARVVRRSELKWASVVACIGVAFGLLIGSQTYSLTLHLFLAALSFCVVLLGGYAGARRNAKAA